MITFSPFNDYRSFKVVCLIVVLSSFSFELSSTSLNQLSEQQIVEAMFDDATMTEVRENSQIIIDGMSEIEDQHYKQEAIDSLVNQFINDEISNEDFWIILDEIKLEALDGHLNFESKIKFLSPKSNSSLSFYLPFYTVAYDTIFGINDYLRKNGNLTISIIESLEVGDYENYDYLQARGFLLNSEFLKLYAKNEELGLLTVLRDSLYYVLATTEADILRIGAETHTLIALYLLNELDRLKINNSIREINRLNRKLKDEKGDIKLQKALDKLEKIQMDSFLNNETLKIFDQLTEMSKACYTAIISLGSAYSDMARTFDSEDYEQKYENKVEAINMRIESHRSSSTLLCEKANELMVALQDKLVELVNTHSKE